MNQSNPKDETTNEDPGSRDMLRGHLNASVEVMLNAIIECDKLKESHKKDVTYRYAQTYIGIAMHHIELAQIVMRKRKKRPNSTEPPREEVELRSHEEIPEVAELFGSSAIEEEL